MGKHRNLPNSLLLLILYLSSFIFTFFVISSSTRVLVTTSLALFYWFLFLTCFSNWCRYLFSLAWVTFFCLYFLTTTWNIYTKPFCMIYIKLFTDYKSIPRKLKHFIFENMFTLQNIIWDNYILIRLCRSRTVVPVFLIPLCFTSWYQLWYFALLHTKVSSRSPTF